MSFASNLIKDKQLNLLPVVNSPYCVYMLAAFFFIFKLSHLNIPYYWDELGVYTKASLYMHDNGITLLPGIIPAELSRGHPLLCAAIFGTIYKIFGPYVWAGHLAAITISSLLLVIFNKLCREILSPPTALFATIILIVQPVFVAQSGMVLPEMLLALFCTGALLAYVKRQLTVLALFSALAIMTKETAIALPAAIFAIEGLSILISRRINRTNLQYIAAGCFPLLVWGLFLVGQKIQHGWFFFPLHSDYVSFSINQIFSRACYYVSFLLKGQGRYLWTLICFAAVLIFLKENRKSLISNVAALIQNHLTERTPWTIFIAFSSMALIVSSLNFHLARYTLFFLPAVCLMVLSLASYTQKKFGTPVTLVLMGVMFLTPLYHYEAKVFTFDADMGYRHAVLTQKEATDFIDHNYTASTNIMSDFPMSTGLSEPRAGYTEKQYNNIRHGCGNEHKVDADLYIYSYPGNLEICKPKTGSLTLLKEFKSSFANVRIYAKNNTGNQKDTNNLTKL